MSKKAYYQVLSIIEEIELTEKLLLQLTQVEELLNETLFNEIKRKKRNLVKEMLKKMIDIGISVNQFEALYQSIFSYLKLEEKEVATSNNFQKSAKRVERLLG